MIDWIKRAWRWLFGPKQYGWTVGSPATGFTTQNPELVAKAAQEATVAQKNLRLFSIARERNRLKDEIARLKRNKKKHSHLVKELYRLTLIELEILNGKEPSMAIGGEG